MLSIVIATEGLEAPAVATLAALVPGAASGLVRDVLLADRADSPTIARVADVAGCGYVAANGTRAQAWTAGAARARAPWLMFLRAGAMLEPSWIDETAQFMQSVAMSGKERAGLFHPARSPYATRDWRDRIAALKQTLGRPSADQGLLIARDHLERLGGFDLRARNPEAQLLRTLGRARVQLRTRIVTLG